MDINYIKEFLIIAEEQSFSRASEKLFLTQSVLTKHVKKLETELGFQLFVRSYPLTITSAGEYFKQQITQILANIDSVVTKSNEISMGYSGILSIGFPSRTKSIYVDDLRTFKSKYPNVLTDIVIDETDALMRMVQNDQLDIAVLYMVDYSDTRVLKQFASQLINKGTMCILVRKQNPKFADKTEISIKELDGENYILIEDFFNRALYKNISALAQGYNVNFGHPVYARNIEDGQFKVLLDEGILFLPFDAEDLYDTNEYIKLKIKEDEFSYSRYYVWKLTNKSLPVSEYLESCKK